MNLPFFTVFTPVYNRINKINRVFESLQNQTFRNFEWIVVDDGSTDNVEELINTYSNLVDFPIIFLKQQNKGKHIAWNLALEYANGELFIPADSDDRFEENTLDFFYNKWKKIDDKSIFSGLNVLCKDSNTFNIVGESYPYDGIITTQLELTYKYKISGEKWGCIRTDILKLNKFPEIIGRGSYILSYAWFNISHTHKIQCFNTALRKYYLEEDNITTNNEINFKKSIPTYYHYYKWHANKNGMIILKYLNLKEFIRILINTWRYGAHLERKCTEILATLKIEIKLCMIMVYPIFYLLYITQFRNELK